MLTENIGQIRILTDILLHDMQGGKSLWYTLQDLKNTFKTLDNLPADFKVPDTGIAASLRSLRKEKYGPWLVDKRYLHDGIYEYRIRDPKLTNSNDPDNPPFEIGRRTRDNIKKGSVVIDTDGTVTHEVAEEEYVGA